MRAFILTAMALVFLALGFSLYHWLVLRSNIPLATLPPTLKVVGIIDMNRDRNVTIDQIKKGVDLIMVLDYSSFLSNFVPEHPEYSQAYKKNFDLVNYGVNGLIDSQTPIWPYLYVVVYGDDGTSYQVRHLADAGIHAILSSHLTATGNHSILLSDGDTRILYETSESS